MRATLQGLALATVLAFVSCAPPASDHRYPSLPVSVNFGVKIDGDTPQERRWGVLVASVQGDLPPELGEFHAIEVVEHYVEGVLVKVDIVVPEEEVFGADSELFALLFPGVSVSEMRTSKKVPGEEAVALRWRSASATYHGPHGRPIEVTASTGAQLLSTFETTNDLATIGFYDAQLDLELSRAARGES